MRQAAVVATASAVALGSILAFNGASAVLPDGGVNLVGQAPTPGDVQKMLTLEIWVPDDALAFMRDAGLALDGGGHYQTVQARYWYFPDGGLDTGPNWPQGVIVVQQSGPTICASAQVCVPYDGGLDPALSTASGCVCAVDSTCVGTSPASLPGQPVPHGITMPAAGWTGPFTGNCQPKPCGDLWTTLPDGGPDTSWPASCPLH